MGLTGEIAYSPFLRVRMHLSPYVKIYPAHGSPGRILLYSTKTGATIIVSEKLLAAITSAELASSAQESLIRLGFLVPDIAEEKRLVTGRFSRINQRSRRCSFMVVLTLECNLACTYCYEANVLSKGRTMSQETADLLVTTLQRDQIASVRDICLDFYGGEALLSVDLLRSVAGRVGALAKEAGVGFSFNLITNGTLFTRPLAEELKGLGLRSVKFTLDGPRELHDRTRPFLSGRGSFDVIFSNLREVADTVSVQVGGNFLRDTYREFPRLLDLFAENGLTPDRLSLVHFTPVIGTKAAPGLSEFAMGCCTTAEPWLFEAGLYLREEILKRGYHTPKPAPASCSVEFANDLIVNYDGRLYKCPAFIGLDGWEVGHLGTGVNDYRESHNLDVWKTTECCACAYLPLCYGGCRYMKFLRDGKIDGVDCQKEFFDACLADFIEQDLRYRPTSK